LRTTSPVKTSAGNSAKGEGAQLPLEQLLAATPHLPLRQLPGAAASMPLSPMDFKSQYMDPTPINSTASTTTTAIHIVGRSLSARKELAHA